MSTYTKLEYIESTGTQYIDLGFKLSNSHAVDMDLQMVKLNANIFGSRAGAQDRAFTLFSSTSVIMTDMGGTRNSTSPTTDRINVYLSSSKIKIGTFERNINSGSFTTPGNGYIFNISYSRPQSYMASMKLYGCKIYLSGTLIRDLIPCKYNNHIGLWDTINGSFLGNAGTGEFIAGPEQGEVTIKYTELKYIESTGTQYINTGTYPTSTSFKAEIQYQFTRTSGPGSNREAWVFGIWNGSSGWRCGCSGTSLNNVGSGFTFDSTLSTDKTIATSNACTATSSSYQVVLFGQGESGGPGHVSDALFRIYYCKIWNGNILVRDFIPCEYNGKIGLWDRISETFFANNGTGEFVAGPTIGPKTLKVKTVDKNNLYTKLEYIEGTGTQWVDTGIQPITTTKIATKCSFSVDGGNVFIGATELPDNNDFRIFRASGQYLYFDRGSSRLNNSLALNTVYELEFGNWYIKINGQTVQSGNAFNIGLSSSTIKVMPTTNSDYGRIYYLKIYDGDTLVRDFIPTKRNSDNEIGLYDKVTNQFFANNGTGEFIAGPYSLIGKTVSKINGKYAKSINSVSVQCWKKKYE